MHIKIKMDKVVFVMLILLPSYIHLNYGLESDSDGVVFFKGQKKQHSLSVKACKEYALEVCRGVLTPSKKNKNANDTDYIQAAQEVVSDTQNYPFMAVIGYGKFPDVTWWCSGSLIHKNYVLSSAHCAHTTFGPAQWVRLGVSDFDSEKPTHVDISIIQTIKHKDYKGALLNDVVLFKLGTSATFNEFIRPVCLYPEVDFNTEKLIGTEWRFTNCLLSNKATGNSNEIMTSINPYVILKEVCQYFFVNHTNLEKDIPNENLICTTHLRIYDANCQSSFGNPLLYLNEEVGCPRMYNQIGILSVVEHSSFNDECTNADSYSIYTKISSYIPWIERIVWSK